MKAEGVKTKLWWSYASLAKPRLLNSPITQSYSGRSYALPNIIVVPLNGMTTGTPCPLCGTRGWWLVVWSGWLRFLCWTVGVLLHGPIQWRAVTFIVYVIAPRLCHLPPHSDLPGPCLEEPGYAGWRPVVREKTSKRTAGYLASLVTESWSSLPRPKACVRAGDYVLTPVILARGSDAVYDCIPPPYSGGQQLLHLLHIACSACDVKKVPSGTRQIKAYWPGLKACEISRESHTLLYKGFESRGNACIAWHLKCNGLRQQGGYASDQNLNATTPTGVSDGSSRLKHWQTAPSRWHVKRGPKRPIMWPSGSKQ